MTEHNSYQYPTPYPQGGPPPAPPPWTNPNGMWVEDPEPETNLMDFVRLAWARKWIVLGVTVVVILLGTAWALTQKKMYRAETKITIYPAPQLTQNQLDMAMSWWQMDRFISDQMEILQTRKMAERVVDRLGLDQHPEFAGGNAAGALLGRISVEPVRDSFVVEVSLVGYDPETTAEWLNLYVEEYISANIESSILRTQEIYTVIQDRLTPMRDRVKESEEDLMAFRERDTEMLFADEDQNVISEQIEKLTTEYAETKAERIRLETRLNAVNNLSASNLAGTSFRAVLNDATIQGLLQQKADLEVELSEKLRSMKEGHPQVQQLRSSIMAIDGRIFEQIETIKTSARTEYDMVNRRERSLYSNIQQLKEQSIGLSKQTLEYQSLEEEYRQNKAFLDDMLSRSKEADISQTTAVNNISVIEPARPPGGPFKPNPKRVAILSTVLGLFLGVGLVFILDFLDHTLRTPEQVERYLGLDSLTVLPKFTGDATRAMREAFQSLRTAVILAARGNGSHVIQITSAVPSEGKTTVSWNLSKVLATGGSKVLLIDGDLRKPRVHRMINAKNVRGLTSVVLGERELDEVIHTQADLPNLHVVTSGPLPPNPPELFGKGTFLRMLASAREDYDWIILDTPPVTSVTDPVMAARTVDMLLLVTEYGGPRRELVREAVRLASRTGVRIAGVVLNKVDTDKDHYYYSGYYSYYNYGDNIESAKKTKKTKKKARAKAG